jgi:nucleoside phosphorylase
MRTLLAILALVALPPASHASSLSDAGICDTLASHEGTARIGVLSAFPAELRPLARAVTGRERIEIDGHPFYVGELGGLRVVLSQTNIGMLNAAATTAAMLQHFDVAAIVFSGVAGSPHRIGDVTVPLEFEESSSGQRFGAEPQLVALARKLKTVKLERCTEIPASGQDVCMRHRPRIFVGGVGESGDPFGGTPLRCQANNDDVFGCDIKDLAARAKPVSDPVAQDMETAAVARVASSAGIPWIGFRGVSDGAGDPLDLGGFPAQFFAYYNLAAVNSAEGAIKLLQKIGRVANRRRARLCRSEIG